MAQTDRHTETQTDIATYRLNRPRGGFSEKLQLKLEFLGLSCPSLVLLLQPRREIIQAAVHLNTERVQSGTSVWNLIQIAGSVRREAISATLPGIPGLTGRFPNRPHLFGLHSKISEFPYDHLSWNLSATNHKVV